MSDHQILNERPFNLADEERYIIIMTDEGARNFALTRKYQGKPVFSTNLKEAKTYKSLKLAEKVIQEVFEKNLKEKASVGISQVKDIFEPRYFVKYDSKTMFTNPTLKCYVDWYVQGGNDPDTYLDYDEAIKQLEKYKNNLVEFHYNQIMLTRNQVLKKI
jgi:hypothetical protein